MELWQEIFLNATAPYIFQVFAAESIKSVINFMESFEGDKSIL